MTERLARFIGREVRVLLPSSHAQQPPHTVHGILLSCDDSKLCVRGKNGYHFLVPLSEFAVLTIFRDDGETGNLPRPA